MQDSYRKMYYDRLHSISSYADAVKTSAHLIANSDNPILAWFIEWERFSFEANLDGQPINTYPALMAWIESVQECMVEEYTQGGH